MFKLIFSVLLTFCGGIALSHQYTPNVPETQPIFEIAPFPTTQPSPLEERVKNLEFRMLIKDLQLDILKQELEILEETPTFHSNQNIRC